MAMKMKTEIEKWKFRFWISKKCGLVGLVWSIIIKHHFLQLASLFVLLFTSRVLDIYGCIDDDDVTCWQHQYSIILCCVWIGRDFSPLFSQTFNIWAIEIFEWLKWTKNSFCFPIPFIETEKDIFFPTFFIDPIARCVCATFLGFFQFF